MEEQTQQRMELLRRDNERLKQEVEGFQEQATPQQQHIPAPCQAPAGEQSRRTQELEREVERLRQGNERLQAEARLQQVNRVFLAADAAQGSRIEALEQECQSLRVEVSTWKEAARLKEHEMLQQQEAATRLIALVEEHDRDSTEAGRAMQRVVAALSGVVAAPGRDTEVLQQDDERVRQGASVSSEPEHSREGAVQQQQPQEPGQAAGGTAQSQQQCPVRLHEMAFIGPGCWALACSDWPPVCISLNWEALACPHRTPCTYLPWSACRRLSPWSRCCWSGMGGTQWRWPGSGMRRGAGCVVVRCTKSLAGRCPATLGAPTSGVVSTCPEVPSHGSSQVAPAVGLMSACVRCSWAWLQAGHGCAPGIPEGSWGSHRTCTQGPARICGPGHQCLCRGKGACPGAGSHGRDSGAATLHCSPASGPAPVAGPTTRCGIHAFSSSASIR